MAQQTINIGSGERTGDGESIRNAFSKVNQNFTEIYSGALAGVGPTGPIGPTGPAGAGSSFDEGKSVFVAENGSDTNTGISKFNPFRTIKHALTSATTGTTVFIGPGLYTEIFPLTIPKGVTIRGSGIRATTVHPTTATNSNDGFLLNGETTLSDFNITGQYWNTATSTGYAFRVATSATFTTRSPYLERITVLNRGSVTTANDPYGFASGDAGRGVLIDASVINSNSIESAILFNEFTLIVPGSIGFHLKNGARTEMLTSFTYFADKAIWAESENSGRYNNGKTRLRVSGHTGFQILAGQYIRYYVNNTLITQGQIESYVTATNTIIIDGKVDNFVEYDPDSGGKTLNMIGNATFSTVEKYFGVSSLYFNNPLGGSQATGYAYVLKNPDFNFGNGDCTFEFFVYISAFGAEQILLSTEDFVIKYTISEDIQFIYNDGAITQGITSTGPYATDQWHFVSVSRSSGQTYLHVNGLLGSTPVPTNTFNISLTDIKLGASYASSTNGLRGYIDSVRVSKGIARYTTSTYTVPTEAFTSDGFTVLLLQETAASGTKIVDGSTPRQDIRFSSGATANYVTLVDYKDFGAEVRAIACANVYGNVGVYADGTGNLITLMSHNFSYIGTGGDLSNDPDLGNQDNEVVAVNNAKVYYHTIDQNGDIRIGDFFLLDQQRGKLTFSADALNLQGINNISFNTNGGLTFGDGSIQLTSGSKPLSGIYYVDQSGNSQLANGSSSLPFPTITQAHDYITANYENTSPEGNHVAIVISPGVYTEGVTITRNRTHLIGLTDGKNKTVTINGDVKINYSPAYYFASNEITDTFEISNIHIAGTGTSTLALVGNKAYTFRGKNLDIKSSGFTARSITAFNSSATGMIVELDGVNIVNTETSFAVAEFDNVLSGEIRDIKITGGETDILKVKNSRLNIVDSQFISQSVINDKIINIISTKLNTGTSLTANNIEIRNPNPNGTGIYIYSTGSAFITNSKFFVGDGAGSGKAIDGEAGGVLSTNDIVFGETNNKSISTNLNINLLEQYNTKHQNIYANHILPNADLTYDLGSTSSQWRSLYVGTSTIYLGGTALSVSGGNLTVDGSPVSGGGGESGSTLVNGTYTVSLTTTGNVVIPNIIRGTTPEGITLAANYTAYIVTDYGDNNRTWTFDGSSGETILPNGTIIGSDGNVNTIISVPGVTTGTFVDWAFEPNGKIVLPNLQSIDSSDPITLVVGTDDAKLTLDNFNQAALLQAKKSFVRNFYENDEANFSYTNVSGQGTISITLLENGLYFRTLLQRLADQFSGNLQFPYSYSNIQATVNPGAENIVTTVTNVIQGFGPNDYVMEVNQLPDPDPFTCTNITISYDYLNTVGVDVDKDMFGISTDNDDIIITSGRDINLQATDDLRLTAGSNFELELSQLDGQVNTDGLEIRVSNTLTTHNWIYRFDGVTQLPSGLTASPISNFVPVNGTVLQQTENEILQVVSKGLSGGMTVGWAENPFEPSKVAALTFNATSEQVRIATGSYTGTVNTWAFDQTGTLVFPDGTTSTGAIVSAAQSSSFIIQTLGSAQASPSNVLSVFEFGVDGTVTLPGGGVIDGSDYDVEIIAGNDGSSTFGSVTINTQAPPAVYTVVQQWSPFNLDTISTDASETPYIASIVPGMTVTGAGITATTTVTNVTGPDEYGAFFISVSPASETGLNYNETYTFTSAGGVTNRNWEFNSLGEIYLPRGGVIQETDVTNEAFGTTTTSLTLVPAGAANGTQRLEIYGTAGGEGNHIHITSGDQNQTDLYLGNDTQFFAVGAMGQIEVRARPGLDSPSPGTGAESGSPVWIYAGDAGDNGGNTVDGAPGGDILLQSGVSSTGLGGEIILISANGPAGFGSVKLSTDGGSSHLEFDQNNTLTFPSGGGIIFDSSATSTIAGVGEVIFADGTTQTSAWLAGTVSSVQTTSLTTFIPETGTFTNTNQLSVSHQAHAADVGFTFTIDYQSPLDETKGVTVGAINTPLILSTGSVKVRANLSTSTEWTFGTGGGLTFPDGTTQTTAFTGVGGGGGVTSLTAGTGTFVSSTSGAVTIWVGNTSNLEETFESKTTGTGVMVFDCTTNRLFYQTGLTGNITPNFTNLDLTTGEATSISLVVVQGATGRSVSGVQIAGTTTGVTLVWQGSASAPAGNASRTDVFSFSILCTATNAYTVLGMLTSFGGV